MRARLRLSVLTSCALLAGASCVVDEYWIDELTLTVEPPANEVLIRGDGTADGNISWFTCTPRSGWEDSYSGTGTHDIEILTESADERSTISIAAWEDLDGDGSPDCDEPGITVFPDLDVDRELTIPAPGQDLTAGGADLAACQE